jgi:hypothetical protein
LTTSSNSHFFTTTKAPPRSAFAPHSKSIFLPPAQHSQPLYPQAASRQPLPINSPRAVAASALGRRNNQHTASALILLVRTALPPRDTLRTSPAPASLTPAPAKLSIHHLRSHETAVAFLACSRGASCHSSPHKRGIAKPRPRLTKSPANLVTTASQLPPNLCKSIEINTIVPHHLSISIALKPHLPLVPSHPATLVTPQSLALTHALLAQRSASSSLTPTNILSLPGGAGDGIRGRHLIRPFAITTGGDGQRK